MTDDKSQIIALLKNLKLFEGLDIDQLGLVAEAIRPIPMSEADTLHVLRTASPFYIVVSGKVRYSNLGKGSEQESYVYKPGDFFGAEAVFRGRPKAFDVAAEKPSLLFCIPMEQLRKLLNTVPAFTNNVKNQLAWYNLIHSKHFSWLDEDETVKVICRKHTAYLFVVEIAPLIVAWVGVVVIFLARSLTTSSFRLAVGWFGAGLVGIAVLWAIWRFFDWGNDYYIVTEERIVWLERTIGLYDSRQEAPLVAIKAGETKSSQIGRWLGYGDVITQTFMGQIFFRHIGTPGEIKNLIDREHRLALERQTAMDIHTIEGTIRQKIEPLQAATVPSSLNATVLSTTFSKPGTEEVKYIPEKLSFWQALVARFQTRRESDGMITYRKHLYVLFRMTWLPALMGFGALFVTALAFYWRTNEVVSFLTPGLIVLIGLSIAVLMFLWWLYRFVDWSNDIYRITPEKIIDSERKPLGDEITKSAPLENIIGLDYERFGILGVLLNFGNVVINIGTDNKFIFYGIHNPARAQRDIFNYMFEHRRKKKEADTQQEQERLSSYIAAYHRQAEELRQPKKPPKI